MILKIVSKIDVSSSRKNLSTKLPKFYPLMCWGCVRLNSAEMRLNGLQKIWGHEIYREEGEGQGERPPFHLLNLRLRRSRSHRITLVSSWLVSNNQFFSKTALRIFLIFCMKVPYYKGKKRTRRFFRKNSGSLIMRKNAFFALPRIFLKNV